MESTNQQTINNRGTKVLFKNRFLEKLTRTHILVPISILTAYALVLLYFAAFRYNTQSLNIILLFIGGMLAFTFVEYLVHRHIFHMDPTNKIKQKIQYTFHGVHHEYPRDKDRLAMPPLVSATIATILLMFFRLIMGDYAFSFLPGFLIGYSLYLGIHFAVHAFQPPQNFLKSLWVNHGIHHYKDHERAFGVSSPFWDFIFRTMPNKKK